MNSYKTHSFYKYLLSTYYVSITVLRSGNTAMNKWGQNPYPNETYIPEGDNCNCIKLYKRIVLSSIRENKIRKVDRGAIIIKICRNYYFFLSI